MSAQLTGKRRLPFSLVTLLVLSLSAGGASAQAVCGDGRVEGAEACDDGNLINFDRCTNSCQAGLGIVMRNFLPGSFFMGGGGGQSDELPAHQVVFSDPFSLSRTEITVAQYRHCVEANACSVPRTNQGCNWGRPDRDDHPIN
ncbi:MAG: SUMF1/EgtB/PvdO family nonheme iron enzyme, partial [Myxococcota bacterium]|nr:SUMF1/EgtB/PvdO family nonheme iron enzyme [Myxococcota bacterium]